MKMHLKRQKGNLQIFIISIFVAYLIFYFSQRYLLYHPSKISPEIKDFHALTMHEVFFKTKDGLKLKAWYQKPQKDKALIILFHGNAGHFASRYKLIKPYLAQGYGGLLFSYRGFAGNAGYPSEKGLYLDGLAMIDFAQKKSQCLVYYGESLGTGVATEMAQHHSIKGVILQSPFLSITKMAKLYYPWSPLGPWDKFDSLSKISNIRSNYLLILHGKKDSLIPYSQAITLYEKARGDKTLKLYDGKGHNNVYGEEVTRDVLAFLKKVSQTCTPR